MSPRAVHSIRRVTLWASLPAMVACGPAIQGAAAPPSRDAAIVAIHDRKCGKCHAPPEPGTRTREDLEGAFARHEKRVHLTVDEWRAMTDYLAAPPGPTAWQVR